MRGSRSKRERRGAALVFSVVAVLVVSLLAAGFMQLALSVTRRLNASADTLQAFNLAEAGLAEAYTGLAQARTGKLGSAEAPAFFAGGLLWVEATPHENGLVELESTALYGTGRATLGLVCEPVQTSVGALGLFSAEALTLAANVRLDSFDSSKGTYPEQINTELNARAVAGSNASIAVGTGDLVLGDVLHGPTSTAVIAPGSAVTGGVAARPSVEVLPPVEVPDIPLAGAVKHGGGVPFVVPSGEAGYAGFQLGRNTRLILQGPLTLVLGGLTMGAGSELVLDADDGPIELYVTGALDQDPSSLVTTTSPSPSDCLVFVTAGPGQNASFGAVGEFYGFLYAPESKLQLGAGFEVFGGVVAKELVLAPQAKLHCDLALGATLEARLPKLRSWRVVEMPHAVPAQRGDPFRLLGLDPNALPVPAEAHPDQELEVRYVADDGTVHSYLGQESGFDWTLVSALLYGTRDGEPFFLPESDGTASSGARSPLLDLVDSSLSSKDLRDALLADSPLPEEVLVAAAERVPAMSPSDLKNVLDANRPMGLEALLAAITSAALDSSTLKGVLIDNSPLPLDALNAVLSRSPPLSLSDLLGVLAKQ